MHIIVSGFVNSGVSEASFDNYRQLSTALLFACVQKICWFACCTKTKENFFL